MNWLFIHQNFPGQYVHLVRYLAGTGHRVVFLTQERDVTMPGVHKIEYQPIRPAADVHPYLRDVETAVHNGLAVHQQCEALAWDGFVPDMVIGHNGWGEILYVKDMWPRVPLLGYFEFFYRPRDSDVDCDPEFPPLPDDALRLRTRNAVNLLGLEAADCGQTPTEWQRNQYPARHRDRLSVIHEGIATEHIRPDPAAQLWLKGGRIFSAADEVVTYSARNLEPYRGFHTFMRALPEILRRRPAAQVLIVGGDAVSYGRGPSRAATWRQQMLAELDGSLDLARVHFLGRLPYQQYLAVLQLSSVHVYLTYPFVLSWSLLEAMAAGCLVVSSRTGPVEEVIRDGENGWLVDFPDPAALAERLTDMLATRNRHAAIRRAARDIVITRYDLHRVCLPAQLALLRRLTGTREAL
jgi:glycosyltransferase involved in cell wall biosynthesis